MVELKWVTRMEFCKELVGEAQATSGDAQCGAGCVCGERVG